MASPVKNGLGNIIFIFKTLIRTSVFARKGLECFFLIKQQNSEAFSNSIGPVTGDLFSRSWQIKCKGRCLACQSSLSVLLQPIQIFQSVPAPRFRILNLIFTKMYKIDLLLLNWLIIRDLGTLYYTISQTLSLFLMVG